ncbi:putative trans-sialidase [Trypanosoma cruzi]|nr:putative trans-sialidase [Trypanosoma cruzi]
MLQICRTPLGTMILGLEKIAARSETRQTKRARPLTKEGMNQVIRSRTDWKERVVLRLAWIEGQMLEPFYNGCPRSKVILATEFLRTLTRAAQLRCSYYDW